MDQTLKLNQGKKKENAQETLKAGRILNGKYTIKKILDQDKAGIRYEGVHVSRGIRVIITEYPSIEEAGVHPALEDEAEQAERNASILEWREALYRRVSALKQFSEREHLAEIQDYFVENQKTYMVTEYLNGASLEEYVAEQGGRLKSDEVFERIKPIVDLLKKLHKKGLLHRNISPASLMMTPDGALKLVNFDLAGSREASPEGGCTAPEQCMPQGRTGTWTDVYGVCATIYYCLTGKFPPGPSARRENDKLSIPGNVRLGTAGRQKALKGGLAVKWQDRIGNMDLLYQMLYENRPFWKNWKLLVPAALCIAVLAAAVAGRDRKWEVEEYERGSSNGNILNGGRCYADEKGEYFIDSRNTLCYRETGRDETVRLLSEKVKYINVLQDQIFLYEYENGGIYCMPRGGGSARRVVETPDFNEKTGEGIYGLSAVRDSNGDRLYYLEIRNGRRKIVSCGFDGTDREVLLEDSATDMAALSIDKGYIYYQDESGIVSRMRTNGTHQETLKVKDHILTFLAEEDELYMLSLDGASILVTDLEGNRLEEVEGVSFSTLNTREDWIYFQDQEGFLCKCRRDGKNRMQLWEHETESISTWKGDLYVTGREQDYESCYNVFYDMEQETYSVEWMNPFHNDSMRGNTAANIACGPGRMAVRPEEYGGGFYYVDDDDIMAKNEDSYDEILYNRDNPRFLNAAGQMLYFVNNENQICQMDMNSNRMSVLVTKPRAISDLSVVNDKLWYESDGFIYCLDPETQTETELVDDVGVYNMNVIDGYIFWQSQAGNAVKRIDLEGQKREIYKGENITEICAVKERVYVCDGGMVLGMDYDGTIFFKYQEDSDFSLVNAKGEWIYLLADGSLKRINTANKEEEILITDMDYTYYENELYILDGEIYVMTKDEWYFNRIYRMNPDEDPVWLEE